MHVAHSRATGRTSGARHKMLNLHREEDVVLVQDMDEELLTVCPDAEHLLDMEGWEFDRASKRSTGHELMRNGTGWYNRSQYPSEFVDYIDRTGCAGVSCFSDYGMFDEALGLDWHVDAFWVYAWNVEGNTTWHYFDMLDGQMKQAKLGPMDKVVMMPPGTPHRVTVESPSRISLSITRPAQWDNLMCSGPLPEDYQGV